MIARKMAPGLRRSFAFEEWNWVSDRLIQEVRTEDLPWQFPPCEHRYHSP